ncbi:hypothetical protein [Burkholderia sp. Ac-20365]|uniref:hypothetical protein n=1 Tax=Burkholderia sp. Ac-20365 TaxID=2703897 RepID=UPI00197B6458|nr:hypothetical protein [Burkholderia sp. Ac-20365]MBN3761250.1 hypothetical protein [Burkholderia sp. Ac-20365]
MGIQWTIDKIKSLKKAEIQNLMANARAAGNLEVEELCRAALPADVSRAKGDRKVSRGTFEIPASHVAKVAELIERLRPVDELSNGLERRRLQASPIQTLGELWRLFITCGLSSMEDSEEGAALDRFIRAQGPLFDLGYLRRIECDPAEVLAEIKRNVPRMAQNKCTLVAGNFPLFEAAGGAPDTALSDIRDTESPLLIFGELARGDRHDRDITKSAEFSLGINPDPFPRISHKQIRNILVNSGLARNVVPLDSRWSRFFGDILIVDSALLARKSRYLAVEDLLRQALIEASSQRTDIDNLAVLDAIVFQHMSRKGMSDPWSGGG